MGNGWLEQLEVDPLPRLNASGIPALTYFVRKDLKEENPGPAASLWTESEVNQLLGKQQESGEWKYPGARKNGFPGENFDLLQTFRVLGILIEQYGMDRSHPAVEKGCQYLLDHQADEGDIRGIFANQYAMHYTAAMLELLVKAGFDEDIRIERIFSWLLDNRQEDGGWAWPIRTAEVAYEEAVLWSEPIRGDRSKPFSHQLTGFVLRGFAAHPEYRQHKAILDAGNLIKTRFFKADRYPDRKAPEYWIRFQFPFWWANLLTVLDSLSSMDFSPADDEIKSGIQWFIENQQPNGLWPHGYGKGKKAEITELWVGLAVCRMLKRFGPIL